MSNKKTKTRSKPRWPVDIPLPENELIHGDSIFVILKTVDELESFWLKHRDQFPYAAKGITYDDQQYFLNEDEWVFGKSKAAVVSTVCRWQEIGIQTLWYDWAGLDPEDHAAFFQDRNDYRASCIEKGNWTAENEENWLARTEENYRGNWTLENLPGDFKHDDWFSISSAELSDQHLSVEEATRRLQEIIFDDWDTTGYYDLEYRTSEGIADEIASWREDALFWENRTEQEDEAE